MLESAAPWLAVLPTLPVGCGNVGCDPIASFCCEFQVLIYLCNNNPEHSRCGETGTFTITKLYHKPEGWEGINQQPSGEPVVLVLYQTLVLSPCMKAK